MSNSLFAIPKSFHWKRARKFASACGSLPIAFKSLYGTRYLFYFSTFLSANNLLLIFSVVFDKRPVETAKCKRYARWCWWHITIKINIYIYMYIVIWPTKKRSRGREVQRNFFFHRYLQSCSLRRPLTLRKRYTLQSQWCGRGVCVCVCAYDANARLLSKCLNCSHLVQKIACRHQRSKSWKKKNEAYMNLRWNYGLLCTMAIFHFFHAAFSSYTAAWWARARLSNTLCFYDSLLFVRVDAGVVFTVIFYLSASKKATEKKNVFEESKTQQKRFLSEFDVALDSVGPLPPRPPRLSRRPLVRIGVGVSAFAFSHLFSALLCFSYCF